MFPFFNEQTLKNELLQLGSELSNPAARLPQWLDKSAQSLLKDTSFIVCGSNCRSEIRVLAQHANVIAIVDDFLKQPTLFGIPVIRSDEWIQRCLKDRAIVSCILTPNGRAFQHFTKLATQWELPTLLPLQFLHMLEECNIDRKGETGRFFWYGYEFFTYTLEHLDRLLEIPALFEDSYSRVSWLSILLYRMTLNPFYLEGCAVGTGGGQYVLNAYGVNKQFFKFSDDEVYVDGGAFTGDTIASFLTACNGKFKHIHSFEPSHDHNVQIRNRLRTLQHEYLKPLASSITLHEAGLWDSKTTLEFNPSQIVDDFDITNHVQSKSAHMVDSGIINHIYDDHVERKAAIQVPVVTIDEATNGEATYLKFEIEGSELKALHGAAETIARNRPKMAVSIYHKPEDLITLTEYVITTGQNYKLGFRQHNSLSPDAMVLYCY
ncbi:FkbM family methyltransferase [Methylovorus glucosotrophus]|uniref:Methyltransferase FkbM family n=1 Tax=Methylovorus glucosotrophus (strain SIP3-4) TaxID=582744 RepID=C6XBQ7_METGS|nr:FkbM family methyltransferase [Methylovorus glucosotrophus]ACT52027.1 methyltransferase FkbM family [Methylovorus glucosotrophus SIP3-4]